jgi:hypothetical protein
MRVDAGVPKACFPANVKKRNFLKHLATKHDINLSFKKKIKVHKVIPSLGKTSRIFIFN